MAADNSDTSLDEFIQQRSDLIALARSIVGSRHIAEELVQESWIRWAGRDYPADKLVPIVRRIVANLSKDWRRRAKIERDGLQFVVSETEESLDGERIVMARQELVQVAVVLSELPKRTLSAFRMHRLDGLTYAEIGRRLGISTTRVHQLLQDALAHVALRIDT